MTQPVLYALVAMACYGLTDFIYKQTTAAGIRPDHFLMAQAWIFCPAIFLYAIVTRTLVPEPAALWGSLAGALAFIGFYYFVRSLSAGAVSTNASIFRLSFIVTVVLVVAFLGEPVTPSKIIGLVLALAATWLLVGAAGGGDYALGEARRRSLIQVAIATLAFGASNFFHTIGLRHGVVPETLIVFQAAVFMPLATLVVYSTDGRLRWPPKTLKYGAPAAIMLLGATIFMLHGVADGEASVLIPIAQMGFIVAALLGIFVLRERITARKVIGLIAAAAALMALAAS